MPATDCAAFFFNTFHFFSVFKSEIVLEVTLMVTFMCQVAFLLSIPSISPPIYLILTSDCLAGTSLSALLSLDVLLLFRARSFIWRLTAMALLACLHRDLAKFFLSCSET